MNKKLFTLMTLGLLTAGSAFNGVNAQTTPLSNGAKLDANKYYYLGDGNNYLGVETSEKGFAKLETTGKNLAAVKLLTGEALDAYLWSVSAERVNNETMVVLKNKLSGNLAFTTAGDLIDASDDPVVFTS